MRRHVQFATLTALLAGASGAAQTAPVPYAASGYGKVGTAGCSSAYCFVKIGRVVPAGKRLTITHVGATYRLIRPSAETSVYIDIANGSVFGMPLPVPQTAGGLSYTVSTPITVFIDAGYQPTVTVTGPNLATTPAKQANVYVVITGYLSPM